MRYLTYSRLHFAIALFVVACVASAVTNDRNPTDWAPADDFVAAVRRAIPPKVSDDERTFSEHENRVVKLHLDLEQFERLVVVTRAGILIAERAHERGYDVAERVKKSVGYLDNVAKDTDALVTQIVNQGYGVAPEWNKRRDLLLKAIDEEKERLGRLVH